MKTVLRALTSSGTYVLVGVMVGVIVALTRATTSVGARGPGGGGGSSTQLAPILRAQEDATEVGTAVNATTSGWGAFHYAGVGNPMGNADPGSRFTLSYTLSQPVGAGSHTVSQELGQYSGEPAEFFYNQNELSVMFVPGSRASVISAPAAAARDELSPTGQKR